MFAKASFLMGCRIPLLSSLLQGVRAYVAKVGWCGARYRDDLRGNGFCGSVGFGEFVQVRGLVEDGYRWVVLPDLVGSAWNTVQG